MATAKQMLGIYLSPDLVASVRADAADKGQSLAVWFERAATNWLATGAPRVVGQTKVTYSTLKPAKRRAGR